MRVVCDNCGAVYKIPESKLVREVNKATCRKCGHGIIIRKTGIGPANSAPEPADGEATQITSADELEALVSILPCLRQPTVSPLHGGSGFAVKAAVQRELLPALLPRVRACGGTDIVVSRIAQLVP